MSIQVVLSISYIGAVNDEEHFGHILQKNTYLKFFNKDILICHYLILLYLCSLFRSIYDLMLIGTFILPFYPRRRL